MDVSVQVGLVNGTTIHDRIHRRARGGGITAGLDSWLRIDRRWADADAILTAAILIGTPSPRQIQSTAYGGDQFPLATVAAADLQSKPSPPRRQRRGL